MYSVAVNIIVDYDNSKTIINDIPLLLCNDNFLPIIHQIRKIISDNFKTYSVELGVPLHCFKMGITIFDSDFKIFKRHLIKCKNVREVQIMLREEYPEEIFEKLMKLK